MAKISPSPAKPSPSKAPTPAKPAASAGKSAAPSAAKPASPASARPSTRSSSDATAQAARKTGTLSGGSAADSFTRSASPSPATAGGVGAKTADVSATRQRWAPADVLVIDNGNANGDTHQEFVTNKVQEQAPETQVDQYGIDLGSNQSSSTQSARSSQASLDNTSNLSPSQVLDQRIDASTDLSYYNQQIQEGMAANPDARVINMSFAESRNTVYDDIYNTVLNDSPTQYAQTLGISAQDVATLQRAGVNSENANQLSSDLQPVNQRVENGVTRYVDNRMDQPGSVFQQSISQFQGVADQAAAQGKTLVVAYGNDHDNFNNRFTNGAASREVNFFTMSPSVVSVGASTDNSSAGLPASFSSRGGDGFQPTLSADGTDISSPGFSGTEDGTSFSAPQVSATISQMLAENPGLSTAQIQSILQSTALDTPAASNVEGAGILNRDAAIRASRFTQPVAPVTQAPFVTVPNEDALSSNGSGSVFSPQGGGNSQQGNTLGANRFQITNGGTPDSNVGQLQQSLDQVSNTVSDLQSSLGSISQQLTDLNTSSSSSDALDGASSNNDASQGDSGGDGTGSALGDLLAFCQSLLQGFL